MSCNDVVSLQRHITDNKHHHGLFPKRGPQTSLPPQNHHSPVPRVRWLTWPDRHFQGDSSVNHNHLSVLQYPDNRAAPHTFFCAAVWGTRIMSLQWNCSAVAVQTTSQSQWPSFLWDWTSELLRISRNEIDRIENYIIPYITLPEISNLNPVTTYWFKVTLSCWVWLPTHSTYQGKTIIVSWR